MSDLVGGIVFVVDWSEFGAFGPEIGVVEVDGLLKLDWVALVGVGMICAVLGLLPVLRELVDHACGVYCGISNKVVKAISLSIPNVSIVFGGITMGIPSQSYTTKFS